MRGWIAWTISACPSLFCVPVLGQASAIRRQAGLRKQGESELFFEGGPQGMRWLGIMPARFGMGGRTHFQLSVEGDALVLRFAPWQGPGCHARLGAEPVLCD